MTIPSDLNVPQRPVKKVLIAVDYARSAQEVAEMGYTIAKNMNAEVILLHVMADVAYYSTPGYMPIIGFSNFNHADFLEMIDVEGLRNAGMHFMDRMKDHLGDENITTIIEEGEVADIVNRTAHQINADIIVIGSRSRNWLEKVFIGSTAVKVLDHATVPLLIIPVKEDINSK
ncbi:MAG TPA: universal stress protein [Prolixibacteraceae bacterium]|nr:universal stress protein [Prolixibacteraceae bacterium]